MKENKKKYNLQAKSLILPLNKDLSLKNKGDLEEKKIYRVEPRGLKIKFLKSKNKKVTGLWKKINDIIGF